MKLPFYLRIPRFKKCVGLESNWTEGKGYSKTTMTTTAATRTASFCLLRVVCSLGVSELKQSDDEFMGGSPWFSGTKHNNTCKPHSCGTLFL